MAAGAQLRPRSLQTAPNKPSSASSRTPRATGKANGRATLGRGWLPPHAATAHREAGELRVLYSWGR